MASSTPSRFVSRGGDKLTGALDHFQIDITNLTCVDLGSHVGGFVDCLLRRGAKRVFSVDTSYGTLAWTLRRDSRVVVLERTNAMHVSLPDPVQLVTIDVGWTRQAKVLPNVVGFLEANGDVVSLIKPHYEAPRDWLVNGVLPDDKSRAVVEQASDEASEAGWTVVDLVPCSIRGQGGNQEYFAHMKRAT